MANRCASLDATWAHLPATAPNLWPHATWLSPAAAAFENDALASALVRASMSPSSPTPSCSTASSASELSCIPHDAPAPPLSCRPSTGRPQERPTGRVFKRKPRASRRAPTTYISADPADFRRMVQEVTGFNVPGAEYAYAAASPAETNRPAALAYVLPTLDTSAFFSLDCSLTPAQREEDKMSSGGAATMAAAEAGADDDSSLLLMQELEAMASAPAVASAFPTLESWGMI